MSGRILRGFGWRMSLLAIVACAAVRPAGATVFAQDGWGWWWDAADAGALGRGGASVAVTGYGVTGALNPAATALSELSYGIVSYSGELSRVKGSGGESGKEYAQRSDLIPVLGGVVLLPRGLRAAGHFRVQSDASYDRTQRFTSAAAGAYVLETKGSGGLSRAQIALSGPAAGRRLLWGVSLVRVQGTVKDALRYDFEDGLDRDVRQVVEGRFHGAWTGSAGFIARPSPSVALGASGTLASGSDLDQVVTAVQGASYRRSIPGRQDLPAQWAVGFHANPSPRLSVSGDFVRTLWGEARQKPAPNLPETRPFHDTIRWGGGLEYAIRPDAGTPWLLRCGYSTSSYHVRSASSGERVREQALSFGFRRRIGRGRAAVDVAAELGKRGKEAEVGIEERFLRITTGLSFSSTVREY